MSGRSTFPRVTYEAHCIKAPEIKSPSSTAFCVTLRGSESELIADAKLDFRDGVDVD